MTVTLCVCVCVCVCYVQGVTCIYWAGVREVVKAVLPNEKDIPPVRNSETFPPLLIFSKGGITNGYLSTFFF